VSLRLGQRPPTTQLRRRVWEPTARFELATCQGYQDLHTLVAFSGRVITEEGEYSEPRMNHLSESQTAEAFGSDDYQVMIVGEKFQTEMGQVAAIIATTEKAQGPGIKAHGAIYSKLDPAMERFRVRA